MYYGRLALHGTPTRELHARVRGSRTLQIHNMIPIWSEFHPCLPRRRRAARRARRGAGLLCRVGDYVRAIYRRRCARGDDD